MSECGKGKAITNILNWAVGEIRCALIYETISKIYNLLTQNQIITYTFSGMFLYLLLVQYKGLRMTVSLRFSVMIKSYLVCIVYVQFPLV